jgi:hypothetical protein
MVCITSALDLLLQFGPARVERLDRALRLAQRRDAVLLFRA